MEEIPEEMEADLESTILDHKERWEDAGFRPFLSYWGDYLANPVGGLRQDSTWMQLLVFGGEFDFEKLIGLRGSSLVISATDAAGSNLSLAVGNEFTISQAYVMNTFALFDLYWKQRLFHDTVEIHLGRMAAGQYFATLPAMGLVVSGGVNGNPTSLFLNAPYHATASASWAAYTKWKPAKEFSVEFGAFQASPRIGLPAYHGADFSIRSDDGVLLMAEASWTPTFGQETSTHGKTKDTRDAKAAPGKGIEQEGFAGLPGIYTFGAYYSYYEMPRFSGGSEFSQYGFYWLAQQMIWRSPSNPNHTLSLWGGLTWSPQDEIATMPLMGFGGIIWQGAIPTRDLDSVLLSAYAGNFSRPYSNSQLASGNGPATVETVIELSYLIQLTKSLQLQPDLQYVIQPSGRANIPNALVIGFQVAMSF